MKHASIAEPKPIMHLGRDEYVGLHERYARWLGSQPMMLTKASEELEKARKQLAELFDGMMDTLFHQKGAEFRVEILAEQGVQDFINKHTEVLDSTFSQVPMSEAMRRRLTRSNYIFSGMKTFHELNEAFPSMLDENGNRKPFEQFLNDVRSIDKTYNRNYLRAEYNFVASSAQMAAKWEEFAKDGDRYNLQYRTAKDDKVRPEHAALDGVTLPMTDPFWEEYFPPNGWNCRCTVVQVRKSKYPTTPHDEAMALGEEALQRDSKGVFHFNPGKEQKSVPDYNPYTIRRCRDCDLAKGKMDLAKAFIPDFQLCRGCEIIHRCYQEREKANKDNLKKYTAEEKHGIYSMPVKEQFIATEHKNVSSHLLKDVNAMDYDRVSKAASLYGKMGEDVRIMPEIHRSETEVRNRLGLQGNSNPDLRVGEKWVDVKSPFSIKTIVSNANAAFKQDAIPCITDDLCFIDKRKIKDFARRIFNDPNNTLQEVYFVVENKLYKITTADV